MDNRDEGLSRIVAWGVLEAVQAEIDGYRREGGQAIDTSVAAIRMIIDSYDRFFHTGRV